MPTLAEKRLIQMRRAQGILVPILEELLEKQCEPEDEIDFAFLDFLVRKRAQPRQSGVFSPSMIGSCIRQAYFAKRGEEKHMAPMTQTNGYFLHGNFIHFKWQFACFKAHRAGLLEIPLIDKEMAVELRVVVGDFGGTIDIVVVIDDFYYIVDFKGVNLIDYTRMVRKGAKANYKKQIVGYSQLIEKDLGLKVAGALLVVECKAGPVQGLGGPLALHEIFVPVEHDPELSRRMRTLRWHDARNDLPPIECKNTKQMQFQECPFSRFCHEEVSSHARAIARNVEKPERDFRVSRPGR